MNEVMKDDSIDKVYVLADYTNKDHASFLPEINVLSKWYEILISKYQVKGRLCAIRISLSRSKEFKVKIERQYNTEMVHIRYWEELDREELRSIIYSKIGRIIFKAESSISEELWIPRN